MNRRHIFLPSVIAVAVFVLGIISFSVLAALASSASAHSQIAARPAAPSISNSMVVSQVYGGGGNTGAPWTNDFIEIFNRSSSPVNITGWSVQYASAGGTTWQVTGPLTGIVPAGGYYLVQEAPGAGSGGPLPTPDASGSIPMSATSGKIALANNSTALSGACPSDASIIDFVGYGTAATCFEGSGATGQLSNTSSAARAGNGCTDTDDNALDFQVVTTITPRNSVSALNPCAAASPTLTPTRTSTITLTRTPTITLTITPGGPTNTPSLTFTHTATPTFTFTPSSPTATPTITNTPTRTNTPTFTLTVVGTPSVKLYMVYANAIDPTQSDEAVRLINVGPVTANIGSWQISNSSGSITLPVTATLAAGQKIWIANQATTFRTYFGFSPDYEYGGNSDPAVPDATATVGFAFSDTGGSPQLKDSPSFAVKDALVYGSGSIVLGWSGLAVSLYNIFPGTANTSQIYYRRLDETTGLPVSDTDTANDWANYTNDSVDGKKILRPGWALTDPSAEDMFFTKTYTDTNVTTKFLVAPDNIYDPVRSLIVSATTVISIEAYEWRAPFLVTELIAAKQRGVNVNIVLDGNPCCGGGPTSDTLYAAQQFEAVGIPVYFFSGTPNTTRDEYRYDNVHAKFMIVDNTWLATGSENFSYFSMPSDNKADGTKGNRGAFVITNAPSVVTYARRLYSFDFAPGKYLDIVRYPAMGTPPPGYSPTPMPNYTSYIPIKPTPLVVTETEKIEIVQSPDNELRNQDSLIGMVNTAGVGDTVMVQQQYERKYWPSSALAPNPRLDAYIAAAQRGADVRILLDGSDRTDCSNTANPITVDYINSFGLPNLQARQATPTSDNIHNKLVLVQHNGVGTAHISSINGSENSSKNNREFGLQITSNAGYLYYKDVFDYDWAHTTTSTCVFASPTATHTPTATPTISGSATATNTPGSSSASVLISEFRTHGPNGGNDEFIELYNRTSAAIDISGWIVRGSSNAGSTGIRFTVDPGTTIPAHGHFLGTNSSTSGGPYSGSVLGDQTYTTGVADDGGIALLLPDGTTIVDAVGMSNNSAYLEGTPLTPLTSSTDQGYERKPGGGGGATQDTDDNFNDFQVNAPSDPENLSSPPVPPLGSVTPTFTPTRTSTPTNTPTNTLTSTPTPTFTPTFTHTPTPISGPILVGHVNWQGRPAQPNALQQVVITLTLKLGANETNYPAQNTDSYGFFTVSVGSLPNGTYDWRVKDPLFLANAGSVGLAGAPTTQVEMGLLRAGDSNDSNTVNATDFNILKNSFGKGIGDPGYDDRADFNGDLVVTTVDFNLLKGNFGQGGSGPL